MKREEYAARLHEEMQVVRVSPALRSRTLSAIREKENPIMKKKLTIALTFALVTLLLGSVALAAASHWGLLDFVGRYGGTHVPDDAPAYIQQNVASWETDDLTLSVREMYYDGRYLQAVVDVKPRDPSILLVSGMYSMNDYFCNLLPDVDSQQDSRTVAQFYREGGYGRLLAISPAVTCENDAGQDCFLQEDGTLTFYLEAGYEEPLDVRDVELRLLIQTCTDPENDHMDRALDKRIIYPMTLRVPEGVIPVTYICDEPQEFPEAGVRVDRLTVVALPLSLYTAIEYSVIDEERYAPLEDALWFEFIDPAVTAEFPVQQRLDGGFTGTGGIEVVGDGRFIQRETLGVNELHGEYTLRAYSAWTKDRYEARTFVMREATEAEANSK